MKLLARSVLVLSTSVILSMTVPANSQEKARKASSESETFPGARSEAYKQIGDVALKIHIFNPAGHASSDKHSAIVFFFGGGWRSGTPKQFEQQCRYLASRGMVAMTAEYRIFNKHGTRADKCVEDGKSAVRWVRKNARRLGVDPKRIAAGGGSAGGHVAACTGVVSGFEATGENSRINSAPNALVLFNPALVVAPMPDGRLPFPKDKMDEFPERMGTTPERISPWHQVRPGAPPSLVMHGKADTTVVFWTAEVFAEKMRTAGNHCELAGYEGQSHGFFNFGKGGNKMFEATLRRTDAFLVSLGFLKGKDTVTAFLR